MDRMPREVMDRIDYHYEALKISDENSDYDESMSKFKHYKPPNRLGMVGVYEVE